MSLSPPLVHLEISNLFGFHYQRPLHPLLAAFQLLELPARGLYLPNDRLIRLASLILLLGVLRLLPVELRLALSVHLCLLGFDPLPDLGLIAIEGPLGVLLRKLGLLVHPRCLELVIFDHALAQGVLILLVLEVGGDSLRPGVVLDRLVLGALVLSETRLVCLEQIVLSIG